MLLYTLRIIEGERKQNYPVNNNNTILTLLLLDGEGMQITLAEQPFFSASVAMGADANFQCVRTCKEAYVVCHYKYDRHKTEYARGSLVELLNQTLHPTGSKTSTLLINCNSSAMILAAAGTQMVYKKIHENP